MTLRKNYTYLSTFLSYSYPGALRVCVHLFLYLRACVYERNTRWEKSLSKWEIVRLSWGEALILLAYSGVYISIQDTHLARHKTLEKYSVGGFGFTVLSKVLVFFFLEIKSAFGFWPDKSSVFVFSSVIVVPKFDLSHPENRFWDVSFIQKLQSESNVPSSWTDWVSACSASPERELKNIRYSFLFFFFFIFSSFAFFLFKFNDAHCIRLDSREGERTKKQERQQ